MFLIHTFQSWGLPYGWAWTFSQLIAIALIEVPLLVSVAFFILADRKIWAAVQLRRGRGVAFQPFAGDRTERIAPKVDRKCDHPPCDGIRRL